MSHFTRIKTKLKNRGAIVKALADLGFTDVEVLETPANLYGYWGDRRKQTAEIIVRRKYVGNASNDIGFKLDAQGNYEAIISEYDLQSYNDEWVQKLTQRYAYHAVIQQMSEQGFVLESEKQASDTIQLRLRRS